MTTSRRKSLRPRPSRWTTKSDIFLTWASFASFKTVPGKGRGRGVNFQHDSCSPAVKLKFPPLKRDSSSLHTTSPPLPRSQSHEIGSRARLVSFTIRVINPVVESKGCRSFDRSIGSLFCLERKGARYLRVYPLMTHAEAGGNFIFERTARAAVEFRGEIRKKERRNIDLRLIF